MEEEAPPKVRKWPWQYIAIIVAIVVVAAAVGVALTLPAPAVRIATYAYTSEMVTLDPSTEFSNSGILLSNLYEPLTWYDPDQKKAIPALATSWSSSADGLNWTFNLRQNVLFQDSTKFNATAVKFSIDRTWRLYSATGKGAGFIWFPLDHIEVVSEYVVKFVLWYPAPVDVIASAGYGAWIMSPNINPDDDLSSRWFNSGKSAGTGPWMMESYDPLTRVVLTRFKEYWGGWNASQYDKAIIRIVREPVQREQGILAGDVDITLDVPPVDVSALRTNPKAKVYTGPSYQNLLAFFNNKRAPLDNKTMRQALSYAMPYKDVIDTVLRGLGTQARGPIPVGMYGHLDDLFQYKYNITKARELLAKTPYPNGGFTLNLTHLTGDPFESGMALLYKERLQQLNITLNILPMEWLPQWELARSGPAKAQDIFVMYWWPTYVTPYDFLFNMFHTPFNSTEHPDPFEYANNLFNMGYYSNLTFDKLIDDGSLLEGTNMTEALVHYRAAQNILIDDAPAMFLFDRDNLFVTKAGLKGFVDNRAYPGTVFFYKLYS